MTDSFDYSKLVHPAPQDDAGDLSVMEALHVYRAAEAAMRRRTGAAMGLGENDLLALRFVLDNTAAGRTTAPKDVTRYLGISSASTTVLLRRLEESNYITRKPSATDGRLLELSPTPAAEGGTGPMIAAAEREISTVTEQLSAEESKVVIRFLTIMRQTVDRIGSE